IASCADGGITCTDTMTNAADGTSCGSNQVCSNGQCVACTAGTACNPNGNPCQTGVTSCATGHSTCTPIGNGAGGTPCNDGNLCTTGDVCMSGACTGAAVACTASDQCHAAGVCDPTTGACSNPPQQNGTGCNDGDPCHVNAQCQNGVCSGSLKTCTPSD